MKCDEVKPRCKPCSRIDSACLWPSTNTRPRHERTGSNARSPAELNGNTSDAHQSAERDPESRAVQHSDKAVQSPTDARTPAVNEAAAALVGIRDGWQDSHQAACHQPPPDTNRSDASGLHQSQSLISTTAQSYRDTSSTSPTLTVQVANTTLYPTQLYTPPDAQQLLELNAEDAAHIWADLLLKDASLRTPRADFAFFPDLGEVNDVTLAQLQPSPTQVVPISDDPFEVSYADSFVATRPDTTHALEHKAWQSPVPLELLPHEYPLFYDFIQNLSQWVRRSNAWTGLSLTLMADGLLRP